jgi:putative hydrolase of the HAD superfamily
VKYKNIIFDLFGTLIEDEEIVEKGKILKENLTETENTIFVAFWRDWHRHNFSPEVFLQKIRDTGIFDDEKIKMISERVTLGKLSLYDDVTSSLKTLKENGHYLYILSNAPPQPKQMVEEGNTFGDLITRKFWSFEMECMKPEKLIFDTVLKEIESEKTDAVYVGDSFENDFLGPTHAGLEAILIDRKNKFNLKNTLRSLPELINLV